MNPLLQVGVEAVTAPRRAGRGVEPGSAPRVVVLAEGRYLAHLQPTGLHGALRRRGVDCELVNSDHLDRPSTRDRLASAAVVVARGRSPQLLRALEEAEQHGAVVINRAASVAGVRDKARMADTLARAGLPTPTTSTGSLPSLAATVPDEHFPLVVKPVFGDNAERVAVVADRLRLASLPWDEPVALVQPYVANDGFDLKLYGIGDRVWAVRKPSPLRPELAGAPATPVSLVPDLADLAAGCRRPFGLELFGIDCVAGPEGYVVIEVNDFPNYSALPDADDLLAGYVIGRARGPGGG